MPTDPETDNHEQRWTSVRQAGLAQAVLTQDRFTLGELARRFNLPWVGTLDEVKPSHYLALEYRQLMSRTGFGSIKRDRLLAILEAVLGSDLLTAADTPPPPKPKTPRETLLEWRVPDSFPVALMRVPARIASFCENEGITTLGGVIDAIESLGETGLLRKDNMGRKSVGEILILLRGLQEGDAAAVRQFLPLADDCVGLSLPRAVRRMIDDLSPRQRPLMERRLVQKMTLEEAAEEAGLTRERVRQVARDFLLVPLQNLLDWFPTEQQELLQLWLEGGDLRQKLGPFRSPADEALTLGAIAAVFEDEPEAVAASLNQEQQFEAWHDEMRGLAEFQKSGVDFQGFLDRTVPARLQAAFTDHLFQKPGLTVDHESGRITPERGSLRRLVLAILKEEDDPMPATWLVRLVQESEFYREMTVEKLLRSYRYWTQRYSDFPRDRILWNE